MLSYIRTLVTYVFERTDKPFRYISGLYGTIGFLTMVLAVVLGLNFQSLRDNEQKTENSQISNSVTIKVLNSASPDSLRARITDELIGAGFEVLSENANLVFSINIVINELSTHRQVLSGTASVNASLADVETGQILWAHSAIASGGGGDRSTAELNLESQAIRRLVDDSTFQKLESLLDETDA